MRWKLGCKTVVPVLGIAALLFGAPAVRAATLEIQSAEGEPGSTVQVDAILVTSQGEQVAGTDNVIEYTAGAAVTGCTVNAAIEKTATAFSPGEDSIRALVLSLSNVCTICDVEQCTAQDPSTQCSDEGLPVVVYTCDVEISADAQPGDSFALTCSGALGSSPGGDPIELFCTGATISVPVPADTPTPTFTPPDTPTPVPTDTRPPSTGEDDDDGCQVVAPASGRSGWLLLVPVGVLLWVRRRTR